MKKNCLTLGIIFFSCVLFNNTRLTAQTFMDGTQVVNLGLGFGSHVDYFGTLGFAPALSVSYDRCILTKIGPGNIGVGAEVAFKHTSSDFYYSSSTSEARWNDILIAARGSYHLTVIDVENLDVYGVVEPGIRIQTYSDNNPGYSYSSGGVYGYVGVIAGCGYYFSKNVGCFAEAGLSFPYAKVGLNFKF